MFFDKFLVKKQPLQFSSILVRRTAMKKLYDAKLLAAIVIFAVFIIDYYIPPGTAVGVLYLIALPLLLNKNKITIVVFAAVITFLILENLFYFVSDRTPFSIYGDRALSVLSVWIITYVLIRYKILRDKKEFIKEKKRQDFQKMLFITNHKVRHSVATISGISQALTDHKLSETQIKEMLELMKKPIDQLDDFTQQLTDFMVNENKKD